MQVLFIRASNLTDADLDEMAPLLKANSTIKVLDVSSNPGLSPNKIVDSISQVLDGNRTLEYFGLSKLRLTTEVVRPLFGLIGRFSFPEDKVAEQQALLKERDTIIEKNKK